MAEFALTLDPCEKILFSSKTLGEEAATTTLTVTNPLAERVAVKVKCTSNELFRIRPPVFCLNANEKASVTLTFNSGKTLPDGGKHYFAVYYIKPTGGESSYPRTAWSEHKGDPLGTKRIYVDFKKEGDEERKESEEKEEQKEEKKEDIKVDETKEEKKKEESEEKKDDKEDDKKDEKKEEVEEKKEVGEKEDKKDDHDDSKKVKVGVRNFL